MREGIPLPWRNFGPYMRNFGGFISASPTFSSPFYRHRRAALKLIVETIHVALNLHASSIPEDVITSVTLERAIVSICLFPPSEISLSSMAPSDRNPITCAKHETLCQQDFVCLYECESASVPKSDTRVSNSRRSHWLLEWDTLASEELFRY